MKNYFKIGISGLLIVATLAFFNQVWASTLIASYPSSKYVGTLEALNAGGYIYGGQDFQVSQSSLVLDSASFYISETGSPTGNAYAVLYAMTGTYGSNGKPTGSALATSIAYNVSGLTGTPQTITFAFSGANRVALTNGQYYCIELNYSGSANQILIGGGTSSLSGDFNYSSDGTTWSSGTYANQIFSVYGASGGGTTYPSKILINSGSLKVNSGNLQIQ